MPLLAVATTIALHAALNSISFSYFNLHPFVNKV